MYERPPPTAGETDGAATDPARRIRSPRRRPARGSRPPHASRPHSTPASRRGRVTRYARAPAPHDSGHRRLFRTVPLAHREETHRRLDGRQRVVVSHAGVRFVSLHDRPGLAGPAPALELAREPLAGPALPGVRRRRRPPGGLQPQPHQQAAGIPVPCRLAGHRPVRAPMAVVPPAIWRTADRRPSRQGRSRAAVALRVPAPVLSRHHRDRARRRSWESFLDPAVRCAARDRDAPGPSARRVGFAAGQHLRHLGRTTRQWRHLLVAREQRCSPCDADDCRYPQSVVDRIVAELSGVYGPYTGALVREHVRCRPAAGVRSSRSS